MNARVIRVIEVVHCIGEGREDNPNRTVTSYFALDGKCLAEVDEWADQEYYDMLLHQRLGKSQRRESA